VRAASIVDCGSERKLGVAQRKAEGTAAKGEILLVDDDVTVLNILCATLSGAGYRCHTASNPTDGLNLAVKNDRVAVVLSDIYMPGMTGFQFIDQLSAQSLGRPCPRVLLLTAQPSMQTVVDALRLGACDFLTKPVRTPELLGAVKKAVKQAEVDRRDYESPIAKVERLIRESQGLTEHLRQLALAAETAPGPVAALDGSASARPAQRGHSAILEAIDILRQLRSRYAQHKLDDIAWDLLLELARAECQRRRMSVSGLMVSSSNVSQTTLLRRINDLAQRGYVVRIPDPKDTRRDFVELTPKAQELVTDFLETAHRLMSEEVFAF